MSRRVMTSCCSNFVSLCGNADKEHIQRSSVQESSGGVEALLTTGVARASSGPVEKSAAVETCLVGRRQARSGGRVRSAGLCLVSARFAQSRPASARARLDSPSLGRLGQVLPGLASVRLGSAGLRPGSAASWPAKAGPWRLRPRPQLNSKLNEKQRKTSNSSLFFVFH